MNEITLLQRFNTTRQQSLSDCEPLAIEDFSLQAETFTSPPKWHLAHTSWFFETFLLKPYYQNYQCLNKQYEFLFNSYYNGVGNQFLRARRGLLTRPTVEEIIQYRQHVDTHMRSLLNDNSHKNRSDIILRTTLGIAHEQQHQELFFTDLKYSLAINPLNIAYSNAGNAKDTLAYLSQWKSYNPGLVEIGHDTKSFAFDNESPRHQVFLVPFMMSDRLVTNAQYQRFIDDDGYKRPEFWLSDGWSCVQQHHWSKPLYWRDIDGEALEYTLYGLCPRNDYQPVCHISGYEADAFARWSGARLPTEAEWEWACVNDGGSQLRQGLRYHPEAVSGENVQDRLLQLSTECWQWTSSAYNGYPGYQPEKGAIGEYNGKFMCNQWVLRGGSCVSSSNHVRPTYRNFFYPQDRWQFSSVRLAKNINS